MMMRRQIITKIIRYDDVNVKHKVAFVRIYISLDVLQIIQKNIH